MPFAGSEEQALAVFTSAGEAARSLIGQRWQVTYYVLAAYAALVTAPELIARYQNWARFVCAFLAGCIAVPASRHLWLLWGRHDRQIDISEAAAKELSLVLKLLRWDQEPPLGAGASYLLLIAAVIVGAGLVI